MSTTTQQPFCPFCYGGGRMRTTAAGNHFVQCASCGARGPVQKTAAQANAAWEHRPYAECVQRLARRHSAALQDISASIVFLEPGDRCARTLHRMAQDALNGEGQYAALPHGGCVSRTQMARLMHYWPANGRFPAATVSGAPS